MSTLLSERREERRNAEAKSKLDEAQRVAKYADMAMEWMDELGIAVTEQQALVLGKKVLSAAMKATVELLLEGMKTSEEKKRNPSR